MRKWGPVLGALLVVGYIASLFGGGEASEVAAPTETVTAQSSVSAEPSETNTEAPATEAPETEPSSDASPTETDSQTQAPTTATPEPSPTQPAAQPSPTSEDEIAQLLLSLEIEPEYTGDYDRDLFPHWIDADRDGCDARREVLIAEAVEAPAVGDRCALIGGLWYSAFDGVTTEDPSVFDIDHMVPLSEAWDSGAHEWTSDQRRAFANDLDLPQALIAVSRSSNRSKSDKDPADWLPPLASYRCQYVEDWVLVKVKWQLSVDQREFSAIRNVLANC